MKLRLAILFLASACSAPASLTVAQQPPVELAAWQSKFEKGIFITASGAELPYRIARPVSPSKRPLVIVLHGSGAIGTDNERQLGAFAASWAQTAVAAEDPPIVLVPQVSQRSADYELCDGSPCSSRPGPSFDAIVELFDRFASSNEVDPSRVYLTGFSMGASAALQLALARPKRIAGMTLFSPVPPPTSRVAQLKGTPFLVVHGSSDDENPFRASREWMEALSAVGGAGTFEARQGMGHQVPDDMVTAIGWRRDLLEPR